MQELYSYYVRYGRNERKLYLRDGKGFNHWFKLCAGEGLAAKLFSTEIEAQGTGQLIGKLMDLHSLALSEGKPVDKHFESLPHAQNSPKSDYPLIMGTKVVYLYGLHGTIPNMPSEEEFNKILALKRSSK